MITFMVETLNLVVVVIGHIFKSLLGNVFPPPRKDINGEIIFLTGAGSGLGRLMALKFAKLGAIVVCIDVNESANDETVRAIKSQGCKAHGYKCDCGNRQDVYRVADLVKKQVGDVTILINNAAIVSGKKFLETEDWMVQKTIEVNTMAHFWVRLHLILFTS